MPWSRLGRRFAGRPSAALRKLEDLSPRCEAHMGRHAPLTLHVLMRRMATSLRLGIHGETRTLADDCFTRIREIDQVSPTVLEALAQSYASLGAFDRAEDVARRWRARVAGNLDAERRAHTFEVEIVEHRHRAEQAALSRRAPRNTDTRDDDET